MLQHRALCPFTVLLLGLLCLPLRAATLVVTNAREKTKEATTNALADVKEGTTNAPAKTKYAATNA